MIRQVVSLVFLLLAVTSAASKLQGQSGRARTSPPAKPASSPGQTATDSGADEVINRPGVNGMEGNGETIEGDTLRINTSLVTVPVSVMDRNGKYVPNLQRSDFHVFDNGVEQRIAYFAMVDQPFTVVLLIDTSGSTHFRIDEIQDAAISFVNQLKDEDRVMVMSFDDQIRVLTEPTNNRADLVRAIRRARTGGGTRLYDAVENVLKQKLSQISGRKAVVVFTDGVDTTSNHASYDSTIRLAEESDGAVYSVAYDTSRDLMGPGGSNPGGLGGIILGWPLPGSGGGRGGPGSSPADYKRASQYLHEIAFGSGGRYFHGDTMMGISAAFAQVAEELRRQYSLGYYPTPVGEPGQRRQIKVRVSDPGLVVKSRDNYVYSQKLAKDKENKDQSPGVTSPPVKHLSGSP